MSGAVAAHRFDNGLRYRDEAHPNQTQLTPPYVLEPVRQALGDEIELDPCTEPDNPTGAVWRICLPTNGLDTDWSGFQTVFCNPPYGKAREPWVRRCAEAAEAGSRVVLLIPAAMDTRIVQSAMSTADAVVFIRGRVKFGVLRPNRRQQAASHPSMLIGWNVDLAPCADLGFRVSLSTQPSSNPGEEERDG